jgi:hypothetical protein
MINASKQAKWVGLVTICVVCFVIGVVIAYRAPRRGLVVIARPFSLAASTAEFTLSNSTDRLIGGFCDAPQFQSNGQWHRWMGASHERQVFYLRSGETTNVTVSVPVQKRGLRVPFVWDRAEATAFQRLAPRLHTRLSNLRHTLKTSGRIDGWHDDQGYLSAHTNLCDLMDVEMTSAESGSRED